MKLRSLFLSNIGDAGPTRLQRMEDHRFKQSAFTRIDFEPDFKASCTTLSHTNRRGIVQTNIHQIRKLSKQRQTSDVELLKSWANINSGTYNPEGNRRMLRVIADRFSELPGKGSIVELSSGSKVQAPAPNNCQAYYRHQCRPQAPVQVLLNGHVDTVFGPDHPFQSCTQLEENKLFGPGVTDMKGGLVILLAALEVFETVVEAPTIGWEIILTCDEEIGSANSRDILHEAASRNHLGITFESSLPDKKLVRKRMGVGCAHARVHGRSAHVGRNFREGKNAIVKLCDWIQRIHSLNDSIPGAIINTGAIQGGGPLNVVSEQAEARFNIRVKNSESEKQLFESLDSIHHAVCEDGFTCDWTARLNRQAKEAGPAFDMLFGAWTQAGLQLGQNLEWRDTGGGSDGNILQAAGLPIIDNLGAIGDGIHSPHEYILLDSLTERTELVATFLTMLSNGSFDDAEATDGFAFRLKSLQSQGL